MNDFRLPLAILLTITFVSVLSAQKPIERTFIKSFNLQGHDVLDLYLDGNIEIVEWDSPIVRVEQEIKLLSGCRRTLNTLVKAGKYEMFSDQSQNSFRISMRGFTKDFKIPGACLKDEVTYKINVPRYVNVREAVLNSTAYN